MKKFSKEHIEHLFNAAPQIAPELFEEFYDALEEGGVKALNALMAEKGTFNPHFTDKQHALEFIILMKKFSRRSLTAEEQAVYNMIRHPN